MSQAIGIKGCGYSVPVHVRHNDDSIFQHVRGVANSQGITEVDLFTGMRERRYLARNEQVEPLMLASAQQALLHSKVAVGEIDRLYGYASVSQYLTPNALFVVHRGLKLPRHTAVIPINSEFSNFLLSVISAWEGIAVGHSRYALIVCGTNWTRYMDYTQGHALSIGDGAGAAVMGPGADFSLVDYAVQTLSEQYGAMTMRTRSGRLNGQPYLPVDEHNLPIPTYEITLEAGIHSFQVSAMQGVPQMVHTLLQKHGLSGKDIALITHQASRVLMDHWSESIGPKEYFDTLETFGNMIMATYPVNLAYYYERITADYLVMAAVGVGYHQVALLFKKERGKINNNSVY